MSAPTFQDLRIVAAVFPATAIVITLCRLLVRIRRLWWDDAWAFFSMLNIMVLVGAAFTHFATPPSQVTRVAAYYLSAVFFTNVVWTARLSILFSVIRITPTPGMRVILFYIAGFFILIWAILVVQPFWICEQEPGWKDSPNPQCVLGLQSSVTQIITDVIGDALLIAAPCWDLRQVLDKGLKRRLMLIFSMSIMTTIVSLVHDVILFTNGGVREALAALLEDSIGLIVCNLAVIVTAIWRLFHSSENMMKGRTSSGTTPSISIRFPSSTLSVSKSPRAGGSVSTTFNTGLFTVVEDDEVFKPGTRIDEARIEDRTLDDDKQAGLGRTPESESFEMNVV